MKTRIGGVASRVPAFFHRLWEAPSRPRGAGKRGERHQRFRAPAAWGRGLGLVRTRAGETVRRQQRAHARGVGLWLPPSRPAQAQ